MRKLFPELASENLAHGFYFTHRLDYPTSGVLCLTARKNAAAMAGKAFSTRKALKYYLALVRGHVAQRLVDIKIPIGAILSFILRGLITYFPCLGADSRPEYERRMCTGEKPYCLHPKAAWTRLLVLERGLYAGDPATKVLLKPLTGRRHQLRLHCKSLGHTIAGDFTYSNRMDADPHRMFLHSHRLVLPTPIEKLDVCAGDPFTADKKENQWSPSEVVYSTFSEAYGVLDQETADLTIEAPINNEDA